MQVIQSYLFYSVVLRPSELLLGKNKSVHLILAWLFYLQKSISYLCTTTSTVFM